MKLGLKIVAKTTTTMVFPIHAHYFLITKLFILYCPPSKTQLSVINNIWPVYI